MILITMGRDHPYEQVYFNSVAKNVYKPIRKYFDMDYWGLTYRKGLEKILAADKSQNIPITTEQYPGQLNLQIIPKEARERINYVYGGPETANYYLSGFREIKSDKALEYNGMQLIDSVYNSAATLLYIYKSPRMRLTDTLLHIHEDFENEDPALLISSTQQHQGKYSVEVVENHSSKVFHVPVDSAMASNGGVLTLSAWMMVKNRNANIPLVLTVMRGKEQIDWYGEDLRDKTNETNQWIKVKCNKEMHNLKAGDELVFYFYAVGSKDGAFIDDMELDWIVSKPQ
jgi:hypothetical protein